MYKERSKMSIFYLKYIIREKLIYFNTIINISIYISKYHIIL